MYICVLFLHIAFIYIYCVKCSDIFNKNNKLQNSIQLYPLISTAVRVIAHKSQNHNQGTKIYIYQKISFS